MKRKNKSINEEAPLILGEGAGFLFNEAYKKLRTNLIFSLANPEKSKTIGVTSALAGEGKSTTIVNLAYNLVLTGKKVVVIEADLRKPTLGNKLNLDHPYGLTDLLVGETESLSKIIQPCLGEVGFDVVLAGRVPPNPSELLGSSRMRKVLEILSTTYEYILVDLPPVSAVTDPLIVGTYLDGMMVVVREDYTDKNILKKVVGQIQHSGTKILGFVYNDAKIMGGSSYYYKRFGKYQQR